METIIYKIIEVAILIVAFLLGKYVFPKAADLIDSVTESKVSLALLGDWADRFVIWAKNQMEGKPGEEKFAAVCKMISEVAEAEGIDVTDEQIHAIVESAYEYMAEGFNLGIAEA